MTRLALAAPLLLAAVVHGQTTGPTTVPAGTPRAAFQSLSIAMAAGDADGIRRVWLARSPADDKLLTALVDGAVGMADFKQAVVDKFGADAASAVLGESAIDKTAGDALADTRESVTGDTAVLSDEEGSVKVTFHKIDGNWRLLISDHSHDVPPEQMDRTLALARQGVDACRQTVADIRAGKFPTAAAARRALDQKLMPTPADGKPATQPAGH